jgi:hypothetical protein
VSSAIFLPKSTLLTDKLLNLNLFRSIKMNETTFTYNELKILALMAALMVSGKVKVTVPELMQGYEKDRENVAVLDRELSGAVQVLKLYMSSLKLVSCNFN